MKKFLALCLAAVMVFSLGACSSNEETQENTTQEETTTNEGETFANGGTLRVGVKNSTPGFGYQDPLTGEYEGLEVDLANLLGEALGYDTVEFTTVTAATRGELLDSGDIDAVLATFTITEERKNNWDFSTPYYEDAVTVLVENSSGITKLSDLEGKVIGVSSGSTSAKAVVEACVEQGLIPAEDYNAETFDIATWNEFVSFSQFADYPAISTALAAGEVDAFSVDKSILATYKTDSRSYLEESFSPQLYGVTTKKGSELTAPIEELITQWLEDGTIDELIAKWNL